MRALMIALLGAAVWGMSWLWPDVNQVLSAPVMIACVATLTALLSLSVVAERLSRAHDAQGCRGDSCRPTAADQPSRPVPLLLLR